MEYCGKLFPFVHEIVGLFGNIRNILEIIQKYFWKIVKLCDKDLKFSDTQLCYNHSDSTVFLEKERIS